MSKKSKKKKNIFRRLLFFLILIIILTVLYARYVGIKNIFVKSYFIEDKDLPSSFNNLKIIHFSDIHYGSTTEMSDIKELVNKINDKKPDIVIFTGDLFDKNYLIKDEDKKNMISELNKISSIYGCYYINGEDDLKNKDFDQVMQDSNFISLNDTNIDITSKKNESIILSGISYNNNNSNFLEPINNYGYKIFVLHKPDEFDEFSAYNFNLALAGHSHNNQINIPYIKSIYSMKGAKKYYEPFYKINKTNFYISSGIGTSDYKFRLFNKPSFNVYTIKNNI